MIRLIASDLDGTLLSDHSNVHPDNVEAVKAAIARGVHFAAATGRSAASCSEVLLAHGLSEASVIGVNGCHVLDRPNGKTIALHTMNPDSAAQAMEIFAKHNLGACLYTQNAVIFSDVAMMRFENWSEDLASIDDLLHGEGPYFHAGPEAIEAGLRTTPLKAYCVRREGEDKAFEDARVECAQIKDLAITSSWVNNFEVMPVGVDKGTALRELAGRLGIDRSEVLAFGDSDNDLAMLRWAGYGYVMANAQEEIRCQFDRQAAHCTEGGVAQVIRELVLSKE